MASSLKVWVTLLVLLCLQCSLLLHSENVSRRKFMEEHHLSPSQDFASYKCNNLMKKGNLSHKLSHMFIYISWYKIEHVCVSSKWNDRYRNTYIWAQRPIKTLTCHWEKLNNYRETRSYSYIQFHCSMDGYVDNIEDVKLIKPPFN
ncbi:epididymal protein 3B [Ictidomys tridecemlineatus]|uniref:epididymal secretory protein E3-beta n=1 Tax=Ictidomys tridecemlineatus TaxID=43179 RepID=UPI00038BB34A|nr:epididymal secretory protein E3-beta [Ictidomys tridecemlineatus]KAG3260787.1 epididymal protein 3B [Ictidomys tridecemlineatus]